MVAALGTTAACYSGGNTRSAATGSHGDGDPDLRLREISAMRATATVTAQIAVKLMVITAIAKDDLGAVTVTAKTVSPGAWDSGICEKFPECAEGCSHIRAKGGVWARVDDAPMTTRGAG